MRPTGLFCCSLAVLVLSACGSPENGAEDSAVQEEAPDTATADADIAGYVETAAIGDMFEIESSRIALEKAQSPEIREFAQQMIEDHQRSTQMIEQAIADNGLAVQPPAQLDARHADMIAALEAADAEQFDELYREQQLEAHRAALDLHRSHAEMEGTPLADVAGQIAPVVAGHLEMLEDMEISGGAAAPTGG